MARGKLSFVGALMVGAVLTACKADGDPLATRNVSPGRNLPEMTMGSGTTSTPLGRATFGDPTKEQFRITRKTGEWSIDMRSSPQFDVAVQSIVFQPNGQSGWHSHPGPVFIQVVSGTMTFYQADDPTCSPIVRTAGQGYLDLGEHPHVARNESTVPAENLVTYFAPPGAALKIDQPKSEHCPF